MENKKFQQLEKKIERLTQDLMKTLKKKRISLATMESCTGGALINILTNIPGASKIIKGGIVVYSAEQKFSWGVPKDLIKKYSISSPEVAMTMAKIAQKNLKSRIGIGITGILSQSDPKNSLRKIGKVNLVIVFDKRILAQRFFFPSQKIRKQNKTLVIWRALEMIREILK